MARHETVLDYYSCYPLDEGPAKIVDYSEHPPEREEKRPVFVRPYPTSRLFEFSILQWNYVKYLASNIEHPKWWIEFGATFAGAAFLGSLFGVFTAGTHLKTIAFIVAAVCLGILTIVFLGFLCMEKKRATVSKDDLLRYIKEVDDEYGLVSPIPPPHIAVHEKFQTRRIVVAPETDTKEYGVFDTRYVEPTAANRWGCEFLPLEIGNGSLEQLTCKVRVKGDYWRFGLKLEEPGAQQTVPLVLTDRSFLFHLYRNKNGKYGITAYITDVSGNTTQLMNDTVAIEGDEFRLYFECDYRSGITTFGFDQFVYTTELKPSLMRNAFLLAWWDGRGTHDDYIEFSDIAYRVNYVSSSPNQ